jgi:hypothetical protein
MTDWVFPARLPAHHMATGKPNLVCPPDSPSSIIHIGTSVCNFVLLIFHNNPVNWTMSNKCAILYDRSQVVVDQRI